MLIALSLLVQLHRVPAFPKVKPGGDLGTQRYRLFSAIEEAAKKDNFSDYYGYLWQSGEGGGSTCFLFPVGESKRVFLLTIYSRRYYGGSQGMDKGIQRVTSFEIQKDGRPKRMWQVKTVWWKPDKSSPSGTLTHLMDKGERLPNGINSDYQLWTNKTTAFAEYYLNRFNHNVAASFVYPNGHTDNEEDPYLDLHVDLQTVPNKGFPISKQELAEMKKR